MYTVLVESQLAQLKQETEHFKKTLSSLSKDVQETLKCVLKHSDDEIDQILTFKTRYQELKKRELYLKTFTDISDEMPWAFGKPYDWPQFWLERLAGIPQKNLAYLPYKQCHWCGGEIERPKGKHFCNEEHASEFRQWRDNARRVGKKKSLSDRERYYFSQVTERYEQNQPPRLLSVVYVAYGMAYKSVIQALKPHVPEEEIENPLLVMPRVHYLIRKLLKHYQQRRVLKLDEPISPSSNLSALEIMALVTPSAFMTEEYLWLK